MSRALIIIRLTTALLSRGQRTPPGGLASMACRDSGADVATTGPRSLPTRCYQALYLPAAAGLRAGPPPVLTAGSLLAHQPHRVRELDDAAPASPLVLSVAVARAAVGVRGGRGVAGREQRVLVDGLGVARDGPSRPHGGRRHESRSADQRCSGYDSSSSRHDGSTGRRWRASARRSGALVAWRCAGCKRARRATGQARLAAMRVLSA